jgi:hypothetical protein
MKVKHKRHYFTLCTKSEIKNPLFGLQQVKRIDEVDEAPLDPREICVTGGEKLCSVLQIGCGRSNLS